MTTEEQTENGFRRDEFDVDFEGNVAKKAQWSNKFQCVIALLGYSVGLGNLWRFPYVCQRNGGGAFLIPHMIFTVIVAIPLFFLEAALGQFSRKGPIGVWGLCPLMKGIGFGILIISFIIVPYYSMMFAWALYYIYSSFSTVLPWTTCDNSWNTQRCVAVGDSTRIINNSTVIDESRFNKTKYFVQMNASSETNVSTELARASGHTATEEFWQYKVLGISSGIDDLGTVQLHLFICWCLTCLLLFLSIVKGIKSLGKVVYVTALMPYVLLTVLLVRACMMPGSMNGIMYYVNPDFSRLQHSQVWLEAILQVFFSVGPAWGTITAMSSHNTPYNNIARDAILVTLLGELTSVFAGFVVFATVGFLAHDLGQPVTEVITSGPGIGFIVYPEAVSLLPFSQLWSVLFFLVVLMMGVDSMFGNIEAALGCIEDILPRRFHTKHLQTIMAAVLMSVVFLLGLLFTTNAGMYMYQLLDWYVAAVALFVIGTLECIIVGWCYGMKRFAVDVEAMIGKQLPIVFKLLCFIFVPVILAVAMFLTVASYEPPSYGSYEYTPVAVTIGWCVAIAPVVPIPITMVIQILKERGSFAQRVKKATTPNRNWEEFRLRYGVETTSGYSAFLIPHIIFTITVAVPLFFLEVALGQFSRKGPIGVWAMCPLMKGIGFSIMTLCCLIIPYYSMVFAWALYYIYSSFATVLPWTSCGNAWNTRQCVAVGALRGGINRSTEIDGSISNLTEYIAIKEVSSEANISSGATKAFGHTATEEFWQYKVLGISSGIDDVGTVQLHLLICWFLTCLFLFLCIMKGIRSLGKVVYVTALMPYILLTVLLIRACMMPGSLDGILYYVTPDFNRLQQSQVWLEAILQVFFSVGPAWGTIITMSSHNSPHNNIVRDSIVVTLLGELTSVFSGFVVFATVGFLAHDLGQPVADVITSGPGIGFIVYPEAVSLLPFSHLWSVLFFLIVLMMGVDTTFGNIEAVLACIEDVLPRRFHVKHLQTILAALFMSLVFLFGLPYTTNAGVYMFQLFDWYVAAVACFLIGTLECLVVGWCYGMKRFAADVEAMIGKRLPVIYKLMCFIVVPALLMVAMGLAVASYKPPTYGGYEYPYFAVIIGWCIALSSVVPIPVTFVMQILDERGSLAQRVESAMTPNSDWARCRRRYDVHERTNCTMKDNALFLFNQ